MVCLFKKGGGVIFNEIEYKNPWYAPAGLSPPVYKRKNIQAYMSNCGRGMVLKYLDNHYDYLINGRVITQRAGKSMDLLNQAILYLLDGGPEFMDSDRIKEAYNK